MASAMPQGAETTPALAAANSA